MLRTGRGGGSRRKVISTRRAHPGRNLEAVNRPLKGGNPGEGVAPPRDFRGGIRASALAGICDCTCIALPVQASPGKTIRCPGRRKPGLSPGKQAPSRGISTGRDDARAKGARCRGKEAESPCILIAQSHGRCLGRAGAPVPASDAIGVGSAGAGAAPARAAPTSRGPSASCRGRCLCPAPRF